MYLAKQDKDAALRRAAEEYKKLENKFDVLQSEFNQLQEEHNNFLRMVVKAQERSSDRQEVG
ncbi:hypothetical protein GN156_10675 [bacterium LRH843]|nr:hypothetical protein [bacterium LRH843]